MEKVDEVMKETNVKRRLSGGASPVSLSSLSVGEEAEIVGISSQCTGPQRRRLLDFGIVPGKKIKAVLQSAFGDTIGYFILGTVVGLRKEQAGLVFIKRDHE